MINLINENCMEALEQIPKGTIDLIYSDLPYGITRNKWDKELPINDLFSLYWKVLKCTGVIALHASQPFASHLVTNQEKYFRHEWIWIKNRGSNFANTVREPMKEHESILIFSKGKWTYNKQMQERTGGGINRLKYEFKKVTDTENYGRFTKPGKATGKLRVPSSWQKFNTEVGLHPTQKPVPLAEYIIRTYSNPGEIVLDSCMGSGTTGVACVNTGRNFIGMELDPVYFEVAKRRIREAQAQARLAWNTRAPILSAEEMEMLEGLE